MDIKLLTNHNFKPHIQYLVGIDEAGRGPLAGPVSVGVVAVRIDHLTSIEKELDGVRDSKKLSALKREGWVTVAKDLNGRGLLQHSVSLVGSRYIDSDGIVRAIRKGIERSLARLKIDPKKSHVFLDGGLRAPVAFSSQETIIGGDDKECLIAMASILAKVRRDKYMIKLSHKMPEYGFEQHKGYGTKEHIKSIRAHGMSSVHRRQFVHL